MSNALESIKARDEARKAAAVAAAAAMSGDGRDESKKQLSAQFLRDFERLSSETKDLIASKALDKATESIAAMKRALSESVTVLSAYDIRTSQNVIDKHQEALLNARKTLRPAKKFTFKSRQKPTSTTKTEKNVDKEKESIEHTNILPSVTAFNNNNNIEEEKREWNCNGFTDRKQETLTWPDGTSPKDSRKDFALNNLEECRVEVEECFTALHISDLTGCTVSVAPVNGSVWVDKCRNCTFTLAGHQIRIHETHGSTFKVIAKSDPIIEDCTGLTFMPNPMATPTAATASRKEALAACGIDIDNKAHAECWMHVKDFKWLNNEQQSPNWTFKK